MAAGQNLVLNLWTQIHKQSFNQTNKDAVDRYKKMGIQSAEAFAKGYEDSAPRIRRAANSVADATIAETRAERAAAKTRDLRNKATERAIALEDDLATTQQRVKRTSAEIKVGEMDLASARKRAAAQARGLLRREENLRKKRDAHAIRVEKLRQAELKLGDMRKADKPDRDAIKKEDRRLQPFRKEVAKEVKALALRKTAYERAQDELDIRNKAVVAAREKLAGLNASEKADIREITRLRTELTDAERDAAKANEDLIRLDEDATKAMRKRKEVYQQFNETLREQEKLEQKRAKRGSMSGRGVGGVIGNMLTDLPFVPSGKAGAFIGGGLLVTMASAMEAVVTAGQSIALLPAIATTAAAGIGTLAIGLQGFGDTIKEIGDPEKFAEAIQSLSPAAQQAALEIQFLAQGPLKDLKNATQESLFSGVAADLRNLTNQYLPSVQAMTTGIAGSLNNMFGNSINQLMTPETSQSMANMMNNIVLTFQKLEPAIAPFVDALVKISETGASFLPGFANGIANAAREFNAFITRAQTDGSLRNFMQKGIDAAKALGKVIWEIGDRIMDVFGNKTPAEFKQTLDDMVGAAFGVIEAIVGVSNVVNTLLKILDPIADALGGWQTLIWTAIGALVSFKTIAKATSLDIGTAIASGGTGGGKGFAGKFATALKGFGWAGLALTIGQMIIKPLDDSISRWLESKGIDSRSLWERGRDFFSDGTPWVRTPEKPRGPAGPQGPVLPGQDAPWAPSDKRPAPVLGGISPVPQAGGGVDTSLLGGPPVTANDIFKQLYPGKPVDAPAPGQAGLPPWAEAPVPAPPPEGGKPSDKDIRDALWEQAPGFGIDPYAPLPGMPNAGAIPIGGPGTPGSPGPGNTPPVEYGTGGKPHAKPGLGYYDVDSFDVLKADNDVRKAARELEDAMKDLWVRQNDGISSQRDVVEAQQKVEDLKVSLTERQIELAEKQQGKWKKIAKDQRDVKTKLGLDDDLGLSEGISGFVENMFRGFFRAALSPLTDQLAAQSEAGGGGHGLLGILGQRNMAEGRSPILGKPLEGYYTSPATSSSATLGSTAGKAPGWAGAFPSILKDTGSVRSGAQSQQAAAMIQEYFGDRLRKPIGGSRDGNTAKGTHDAGLSIDIPIDPDQMSLGDEIEAFLQANAAALGLKYTIWRNKGKYPSGGGFDDKSGRHMDHIDAHFDGKGGTGMPIGAPHGMPAGMPSSVISSGPLAGLPLPLPVTIVGGGVAGWGGAAAGEPGSAATPAGQGAERWRNTVGQVFDMYASKVGIPGAQKQAWVEAIVKQIDTESKGDPTQINPKDSDGLPAHGLLQYKTETYKNTGGALTGLPLMDPIGQIAGALLAPRTAVGAPDLSAKGGIGAGHGWGPSYTAANSPKMPSAPAAGPFASGPLAMLPGTPQTPGPFPLPPSAPGGSGPGDLGQSAPFGANGGYTAKPVGSGGWAPSGGGGAGVGGGLLGGAVSGAASMALNGMAPGSGAAAEAAMQLINRTVDYGAQVAGIGASGLLETFGLSDTALGDPSKSWLGRIFTGFAGAKPAVPTSAGETQVPLDPKQGQQQEQQQGQQPGGPLVHIENFTQAANRDGQGAAKDVAREFRAYPGKR